MWELIVMTHIIDDVMFALTDTADNAECNYKDILTNYKCKDCL